MATATRSHARHFVLRDTVAAYLREAIASGALRPGERVVERAVAEHLGMSRVPVREAIRVLELEGLLVTRPHAGATVADVEWEELEEIVAARALIEDLAARGACLRATDEDLRRLRGVVDEIRAAARSGELSLLVEKDVAFHYAICEASKHQTLVALMGSILPKLTVLFYPQIVLTVTPDQLVDSHAALIDAIESRDVERARAAVRRHIDDFWSDAIRLRGGDGASTDSEDA